MRFHLLQKVTQDVESNRSLYQKFNLIGRELISIDQDMLAPQFLPAIDRINSAWQTITVELLSHSRDYDELVKCAEKYSGIKEPLDSWLDNVEARISHMNDIALDINVIQEQLKSQKVRRYLLILFPFSTKILKYSYIIIRTS